MDSQAKQVLQDLADWIFETYKIHKVWKNLNLLESVEPNLTSGNNYLS